MSTRYTPGARLEQVIAPAPSGDVTGVTDYANLQAWATANQGKALFLQAGTYYINVNNQQLIFTNPWLAGAGEQNTTIQLVGNVGAAAGGYAGAGVVFKSTAAGSLNIFAKDFAVLGQYTAGTVNDNYNSAATSGIEIQGKAVLQSVTSDYCQDGFIMNVPQGHVTLRSCNGNFNFNAIREYSYHGDHFYDGCDFTNNSFSSIYLDAACDIFESFTAIRCHMGFQPVGIFQDASNANRMFRDVVLLANKFEAIGNAAIAYGATTPFTAHKGGWSGVKCDVPVYSFNGTYTRTSGMTPNFTYATGGLLIGALEDDNEIFGHSVFEKISIFMPIADQGAGRIYFRNGSGDVINPTIVNQAANPAPQSSWLYLGGQQPSGITRANRQGYIGWTADPGMLASGFALVSGTIYLVKVTPELIALINNVSFILQAVASGGSAQSYTASECWTGLYDVGQTTAGVATLLETCTAATFITALNAATPGTELAPVLAAAVQGYPDGDFYAAILVNFVGWTTGPSILRGGNVAAGVPNANLATAASRVATGGTGTVLPGTITLSGITPIAPALWTGIR